MTQILYCSIVSLNAPHWQTNALFLCLNAYAQIEVTGTKATQLWNQIDKVGKIENLQIPHIENNQQVIHLDSMVCVFENYNACSIFVNTGSERKMIVAMEGTADFMNQLAKLGVWVDEENASMDVNTIDCVNDNTVTTCTIE